MKTIFLLSIFLFCVSILFAQDVTRRLWPEQYSNPSAQPKPNGTPAPTSVSAPTPTAAINTSYEIATPEIPVAKVPEDSVVGITIWRLQPTTSASAGATIPVKTSTGTQLYHAIRVEGDAPLTKGDFVRLSIEASRDGYLYVIDREQYSDGTQSDPFLIFPTTRLSGGDNQTRIGRVIEIPSQQDNPPYLTLTPGRADQVAELISVLVTPEKLSNLQIGTLPVKLSKAQVSEWENSWGKMNGRLELKNGAGRQWTSVEKEAGSGTRLLKHDDPLPQMVYYNPDSKQGTPAFVNVNLRYKQ